MTLKRLLSATRPSATASDLQCRSKWAVVAGELSMMAEAMRPFVTATYALEGDGFLSPTVYGRMLGLRSHAEVFYNAMVACQSAAQDNGRGDAGADGEVDNDEHVALERALANVRALLPRTADVVLAVMDAWPPLPGESEVQRHASADIIMHHVVQAAGRAIGPAVEYFLRRFWGHGFPRKQRAGGGHAAAVRVRAVDARVLGAAHL